MTGIVRQMNTVERRLRNQNRWRRLCAVAAVGTMVAAGASVAAEHGTHGHGVAAQESAPPAHNAAMAAHDHGAPNHGAPTDGHAMAAHDHAAGPSTMAFDGKVALAQSQAAIGRTPRDAVFTATDGRQVRLSDFRGKPVVVSLIYTSCYHICPATTQHLAKIVREARAALGESSFRVLSVGFDTANDTPAAMREFAHQQHTVMDGWEFLSTDSATMARLADDLGFKFVASAKGFDHMVQASVLDGDGKIYRQVYGVQFDKPLLIEPVKELVYATPVNASVLTHLSNRVKLFCTVYDPATDSYRFDYSLFVGMLIGTVGLGSMGFLFIREWRRPRSKPSA